MTGGNDLSACSARFDEALEKGCDRSLLDATLDHPHVRVWNDSKHPLCAGGCDLFRLFGKVGEHIGFTQEFFRVLTSQLIFYFGETVGVLNSLPEIT
jgi:hypothetical protein